MPVLEAMTVGVPVVAANRGSLPEVLGDAGPLVNPDEPDEIAGAMARVARRRRLCSGLRREGRPARAAVQLASHGPAGVRRVSTRRSQSVSRRRRRSSTRMRIGIDARELAATPRRRPVSRRPAARVGEPARLAEPHEFVLYAPEPLPRWPLDAGIAAISHTRGRRTAPAPGGSRCGCREPSRATDSTSSLHRPTRRRCASRCRSSWPFTICRTSRTRNGFVCAKASAGDG